MPRPLPPRQDSLFIETPTVPNSAKRRLPQALEPLLDFAPARAAAEPFFAQTGRPAIPVERMLKAMLIGALFGISSDRRLAEECADSLAFREFLGLGWNDDMFTHPCFTTWRQRLGHEFFRNLLHDIVRQCQGHGMPLGTVRTVNASTIKAQASRDGEVVGADRDGHQPQEAGAVCLGTARSGGRSSLGPVVTRPRRRHTCCASARANLRAAHRASADA